MPALPESMRAAVYLEKGSLAVELRPLPELGPRDALLEVSHCGVCGTDLHMVMEGWGAPGSIGGHEFSGTIAALGPEVHGWELGEPVIGGGGRGCGECEYCRRERPSLCAATSPPGVGEFQGAFADYVRVDAGALLRVPDGLSLRAAALAEPLAVALHGITLSGVRSGQRAFVSGAGPIGALVVAALRARGVAEICVSEPRGVRRRLAERLGAARVIEPAELEVPGTPFEIVDGACEVAFECSGARDALPAALAQLRKTGSCVILGTGMQRPRIDPNRILLNELTLTGGYNYDRDGFPQALGLLASGKLPIDDLIESTDVELGDLQQAMEGLVGGQVAGKVLVAPRS